MKKIIPLNLAIILPGLIMFLFSCTPGSCFEPTTSYLNATFYKTGSNTATIPDSITVIGIGVDTVKIYDNALNVSMIELPLNASSDSCRFFIKINETTDTLMFTYSSYPHLISKECGITSYYNLESYRVSGTKVDTIIFRNINITTSNEENIRIFY